ncbi:MAG TPA: outer membrane beta-barrel protein [Candidatus Polarisedimenticolaceae bacterium]|nr:outer membrane beta-barrel protein [Candidatus Polarisedimenticolaceae bacterium]
MTAIAVLVSVRGVRAEEIEKKWRLGLSISGTSTTDQAQSPSANVRTLFNTDGSFFNTIEDPRNDSAAFSNFGVNGGLGGTVTASYAFTRNWYIEGSAGYRQADVANVEVQAEFTGAPIPNLQDFGFRIFNVNAGTLKQIPLQITGGYRFRPKATFNPYLCAGIGYVLNTYTPSSELDQLSINLENSLGGFARLTGFSIGGESFLQPSGFQSLRGIKVDAPSTPEYHFGGGVEITFKHKWAVFVDARYAVYSGRFNMTINGSSNQLGISVPADQVVINQAGALGPFGAYLIPTGGLIDGGSLVPAVTAPPGTNCATQPFLCQLTGPKDGIPDPGYYYVHAGSIRWDGATLNIGVKYTF